MGHDEGVHLHSLWKRYQGNCGVKAEPKRPEEVFQRQRIVSMEYLGFIWQRQVASLISS